MKLTDVFDQVYIINLVSRPDRMREMRSQLKKIGLSGTEPNLFWYAAVKPTDAAGFPTVGARGCF